MLPRKAWSAKLTGCVLGAAFVMTGLFAGQLRAAVPEFEVASVRLAPPLTPELIQSGKRQHSRIRDFRVRETQHS